MKLEVLRNGKWTVWGTYTDRKQLEGAKYAIEAAGLQARIAE